MSEEVKNEMTPEEAFANLTPAEQAALVLRTAIPLAKSRVKDLTGSAAKRVLEALLEFPLEKEVKTFVTSEEQETFNIATHIQEKKFQLFLAGMDEVVNEVDNKEENDESNRHYQNAAEDTKVGTVETDVV
jgi:hypothetical protein